LHCDRNENFESIFIQKAMSTTLTSRRNFGTWMVSLFAGAGVASALSASQTKAQSSSTVQKLDYDGKPASGGGFITPLIIHNGVIYIAGQGAHSHDPKSDFPVDEWRARSDHRRRCRFARTIAGGN
jgi:hypothetical protein